MGGVIDGIHMMSAKARLAGFIEGVLCGVGVQCGVRPVWVDLDENRDVFVMYEARDWAREVDGALLRQADLLIGKQIKDFEDNMGIRVKGVIVKDVDEVEVVYEDAD